MRKLLVVLLLGVIWAGKSEAAGPTRGAKGTATITYSTTVSSISMTGPAVVYAIYLSTGASGEYVLLADTNTVTGVTATLTTSAMKTRCFYGSTTANSSCVFDPPLQFNLGIAGIGSAITGQALIVYEKGRVTQGY